MQPDLKNGDNVDEKVLLNTWNLSGVTPTNGNLIGATTALNLTSNLMNAEVTKQRTEIGGYSSPQFGIVDDAEMVQIAEITQFPRYCPRKVIVVQR